MFENLHDWSGAFFAEMIACQAEPDCQCGIPVALGNWRFAGVAMYTSICEEV